MNEQNKMNCLSTKLHVWTTLTVEFTVRRESIDISSSRIGDVSIRARDCQYTFAPLFSNRVRIEGDDVRCL